MTPTPIKRHPAIVELSKDHHFGLLLSWKIRKGAELHVPLERVIRYVIHEFETDLEHHFREEEELMFNKIPVEDPLRKRAEEEHKLIRSYVTQMKEDNSENALNDFSKLLENHIRFEERELFNHIQETFSTEQLTVIGEQLKSRQRPHTSMWNDNFWVDKDDKENKSRH